MQQPLMIAHPPSLDRISQLLGGSICINMSDSVLHQNQCKCAFCSSKYLSVNNGLVSQDDSVSEM